MKAIYGCSSETGRGWVGRKASLRHSPPASIEEPLGGKLPPATGEPSGGAVILCVERRPRLRPSTWVCGPIDPLAFRDLKLEVSEKLLTIGDFNRRRVLLVALQVWQHRQIAGTSCLTSSAPPRLRKKSLGTMVKAMGMVIAED